MDYFRLDPEIAGGFGDDAVLDHSTRPFTVSYLHYEIETWRGSEILATHPVLVVTARVRDEIVAAGLTGARWDDASVTVEQVQGADYMAERGQVLPPHWVWLVPTGTAGVDDLAETRPGSLVVSQAALNVIGPRMGEDYELEPWPPGPESVL